MAIHSFLRYKKARYFWMAFWLSLICVAVYILHEPIGPKNGGTWLGYTLGTIGGLLIFWLTYFGVRKRDYSSTLGNLRGWLSAHVYLGVALIFIVTLHTGFEFGYNIHTLSYILMMIVILSGMFGVFAYVFYPTLITQNRDNLNRANMFKQISEIDSSARKLATNLSPQIQTVVNSAIEYFEVGGGLWAQLRGKDKSRLLLPTRKNWKKQSNSKQQPLMNYLAEQLSKSESQDESAQIQQLIELITTKRKLVVKLVKDIRMQGLLEIWLYFHIPFSLGLLITLIAHILSVFIYR